MSQKLDKIIYLFSQKITRGKLERILEIATGTAGLVNQIISQSNSKTESLRDILEKVKYTGKKISEDHPSIFVIGNVVRRCLFIIKDEIHRGIKSDSESSQTEEVYHKKTISDLLFTVADDTFDVNKITLKTFSPEKAKSIKLSIMTMIQEYIDEMNDSIKSVASESVNHVHNNEVIFTLGYSHTVYSFLRKATTGSKKIKFKAIVAEHAPSLSGHEMARKLTELGIETVLVPNNAIYAIMGRVNKVVIGAKAIMANGGLIGESGSQPVCLAAKKHAVPVVVCSAIYKLTTSYPTEKHLTSKIHNPNEILKYNPQKNITVVNPGFDYIPPENIDLLVTSDGVHTPSYIYRLLSEYYDPEDYVFEK